VARLVAAAGVSRRAVGHRAAVGAVQTAKLPGLMRSIFKRQTKGTTIRVGTVRDVATTEGRKHHSDPIEQDQTIILIPAKGVRHFEREVRESSRDVEEFRQCRCAYTPILEARMVGVFPCR
jgi:hypothetical protein